MIDLFKHSIPVEKAKPKGLAEYSSDAFRTAPQPKKVEEKKEVVKPAPKKAPAKKAAPVEAVAEVTEEA